MAEVYASKVPNEIKSAVKAIDGKERYAIMMCLAEHGDQNIEQLQRRLKLKKADLQYHLRKMTIGAIVGSWCPVYFGKDKEGKDAVGFGSPNETTYGTTAFGNSLMKGLSKILELPTKKEAREMQLREYQRLGISPEKIRVERMKRTKELKPKALEIVKGNPDIKPKELKEKLNVNWEDFNRITKRIGYKWTLKDISPSYP